MEPITLIVTALVLGIATGLKPTIDIGTMDAGMSLSRSPKSTPPPRPTPRSLRGY